MSRVALLGAICGMLSLSCSPAAQAESALLFAAASTGRAFEQITKLYKSHDGVSVRLSLAASSTLAVQIANGAPADIFLSANAAWMDFLADKKAIVPESRIDLLGNELALIATANVTIEPRLVIAPNFALAIALGDRRLAVADPDHVPAGMYAKAALDNLGVWHTVETRLAPTANVRAAVELVARGEAPLGIVYMSDTSGASGVRVVGKFPRHTHPPIIYPLAQVVGGKTRVANRFIKFLRSEEVAAIFNRYGFEVVAGRR